jgi:hypothetical protein
MIQVVGAANCGRACSDPVGSMSGSGRLFPLTAVTERMIHTRGEKREHCIKNIAQPAQRILTYPANGIAIRWNCGNLV